MGGSPGVLNPEASGLGSLGARLGPASRDSEERSDLRSAGGYFNIWVNGESSDYKKKRGVWDEPTAGSDQIYAHVTSRPAVSARKTRFPTTELQNQINLERYSHLSDTLQTRAILLGVPEPAVQSGWPATFEVSAGPPAMIPCILLGRPLPHIRYGIRCFVGAG